MPDPDVRAAIESFLESARQPALLEPGEDLLPLAGNYSLETRSSRLVLQAWDDHRNIVRRILSIESRTGACLKLAVELFARRKGELSLIDLAHVRNREAGRRGARMILRERFREMLQRQYPGWKVVQVSAEQDLEHSFSPNFARAWLRRGNTAHAAIAAGEIDPDEILSFGLIWLDYVRRTQPKLLVQGLSLFLPAGHERATCLRLPWLRGDVSPYAYTPEDYVLPVDIRDYGNVDTRLEKWRRGPAANAVEIPGVEHIPRADASVSLRVHGLEFARAGQAGIRLGLSERVPAQSIAEVQALAAELLCVRSDNADPEHPLFRQSPEAWLESRVRAEIETIDATLLPTPIYGQVPAFAGGNRGIMDLLAVDRSGRLAVIEIKTSADLHLPLQALDYWLRVQWHLERGEFSLAGYFPGIELRRDPPRLLLVSPALEFHPTTEAVLSYFAPAVHVERIGVGLEWRKRLQVLFRATGAQRPL